MYISDKNMLFTTLYGCYAEDRGAEISANQMCKVKKSVRQEKLWKALARMTVEHWYDSKLLVTCTFFPSFQYSRPAPL